MGRFAAGDDLSFLALCLALSSANEDSGESDENVYSLSDKLCLDIVEAENGVSALADKGLLRVGDNATIFVNLNANFGDDW